MMIKKQFRKLLLSQVLSAMTVTLCLMIDSMMIGRYLGVDSMSAYGLSTPVLLVFAALGSMISAGIQVVCGKAMGSGDKEGTISCFSVSVFFAVLISVIALVLVFVFPDPLCQLLGAGKPGPDNEIFNLTKGYLKGFILGAPAFLFAQIMVPYFQIAGEQTRLIAAVVVMTIGDVTMDLLNVFVIKGSMFGMGLASSLSYYFALLIGATYFFSKKCLFRFRLHSLRKKTALEIVKHGIPTVINQISLVLLIYVFNQILLYVNGTLAVAAYSVISTVSNICYSFGSGVASVTLTLSSLFYADEDRTSLLTVLKEMAKYTVALNAFVTILVQFISPFLVGIFLTEEAAGGMAANGLRIFVLSLVPCGLNTGLKNFYQGTDRTPLTELISVLQNFALAALSGYILSRFMGATGIWTAYVCGETLTLLIISLIVWQHNKKVTVSTEAYAMLKSEIGVAPEDCFERTIRSREEISKVSQDAAEFCKAHGDNARACYYIALCIEEICTNIVDYGFNKKKENSIDIRYMIKNDRRVLRIRDDCPHFDPVAYLEVHKDEQSDTHMGIRMAMSSATSASYISSLGMNTLILSI